MLISSDGLSLSPYIYIFPISFSLGACYLANASNWACFSSVWQTEKLELLTETSPNLSKAYAGFIKFFYNSNASTAKLFKCFYFKPLKSNCLVPFFLCHYHRHLLIHHHLLFLFLCSGWWFLSVYRFAKSYTQVSEPPKIFTLGDLVVSLLHGVTLLSYYCSPLGVLDLCIIYSKPLNDSYLKVSSAATCPLFY
jgi:hypothetical protein